MYQLIVPALAEADRATVPASQRLPLVTLMVGVVHGVLTVMSFVMEQPLGSLYDIIQVPLATAVTLPVASTVATAVLELLQVPPLTVVLSVEVEPVEILAEPVISGVAITFISSK